MHIPTFHCSFPFWIDLRQAASQQHISSSLNYIGFHPVIEIQVSNSYPSTLLLIFLFFLGQVICPVVKLTLYFEPFVLTFFSFFFFFGFLAIQVES